MTSNHLELLMFFFSELLMFFFSQLYAHMLDQFKEGLRHDKYFKSLEKFCNGHLEHLETEKKGRTDNRKRISHFSCAHSGCSSMIMYIRLSIMLVMMQ